MSSQNRFIAAGTYGCVYRPALSCTDKNEQKKNAVSKVFAKGSTMQQNREDFEEEIQKNKKAQEINAEGAFTLTHVNACDMPSNAFTNAEKESCADSHKPSRKTTLTNFSKGKVPQIVYKDGGFPLNEVWQNDVPLTKFLVDFQNVVHGLVDLDKHRHSHSDIKPANIMYKPEDKRAMMVDFGFLDEEAWLYRDVFQNPMVLMHAYPYYPPEFKVVSIFLAPFFKKTNIAPFVDKLYRQSTLDDVSPKIIDHYFLSYAPLMNLYSQYVTNPKDKDAVDRIKFVENVLQNISPPWLKQKYQRVLKRFHHDTRAQQIETFRATLKSNLQFDDFSYSQKKLTQLQKHFVDQRFGAKIDVYSIGVSLLEVVSSFLIPLMIGQKVSEAQFIDMPTHDIIGTLLYILSGMVHPDPYLRLTAKESSKFYSMLVDAIKTTDSSKRSEKLRDIEKKLEEGVPLKNSTSSRSSSAKSTSSSSVDMKSSSSIDKSSSSSRSRSSNTQSASPMNVNSFSSASTSKPKSYSVNSVPSARKSRASSSRTKSASPMDINTVPARK